MRRNEEKTSSKKFGRSKSSDILKKESVALPYDKGKNTLTRLNSLKQWGRNRFKFMRNDYSPANTITLSPERVNGSGFNNDSLNNAFDHNKTKQSVEQNMEITNTNSNVVGSETQAGSPTKIIAVEKTNLADECDVHELIGPKSEGRFSHERKPSYSSSEKSVSVSSSGHLKGKLNLATCGNVKLRDTSSLNRQRRNGISVNGLGGKDEQPHSSSGNWSASSESGRASIGSEITIQPKSSASNTSLNCSSFHPGSGPPSSMMSRRRFLNTSASSSVTSEGTATPDLQVVGDGGYPCQLDDETSSAYSCDTEGYYTSFHMDSGLRTLKEEEPTLLATQNSHSNSYSFGSQHNQTVLSAENEYELFGKGSTSTTTSSAGTVCTTLLANAGGEQSSMNSINIGPDVPERISSLGKLNRSRESNSASTSTLERSYSSSTMGSTLERTGTIKRNVNAGLSLVTSNVETTEQQLAEHAADTPESQEEEFEFEQRLGKRSAHPLPNLMAEVEVSECSDLEGVERIERIKQKTALNARRIPSMCIITPTTSDDDQEQDTDSKAENSYDPDRTLTPENSPTPSQRSLKIDSEEILGQLESTPVKKRLDKSSIEMTTAKDHNLNNLKRNSQYGLNNMLEKLKVVLPNIKRSPSKSSPAKTTRNEIVNDDELYDLAGEYVTIADVCNNNHARYKQLLPGSKSGGLGIYYSNDIVNRRKLLLNEAPEYAEATLPTAQNTKNRNTTEYVSLNELPALRHNAKLQTKYPNDLNCAESLNTGEIAPVPMYAEISELNSSDNSPLHTQKRVRLNAQGKIIYDSDSLKRRKGSHTTFAPGPCVKETESALPISTATTTTNTTNDVVSESATVKAIKNISTPAKLFLLNGGVAATRKIANVRPIISNTTLKRNHQQQQAQQQKISNNKEMYSTTAKTMNPFNIAYQDKKNALANHTNPFYQQPLPAPPTQSIATVMMASPSTKSTSSTGSSHSTNTSGSAGSSSNNINKNNNNNNEQQQSQPQQQQQQLKQNDAGKKSSTTETTKTYGCSNEMQSKSNAITTITPKPIISTTTTNIITNVNVVNNLKTQTQKPAATNMHQQELKLEKSQNINKNCTLGSKNMTNKNNKNKNKLDLTASPQKKHIANIRSANVENSTTQNNGNEPNILHLPHNNEKVINFTHTNEPFLGIQQRQAPPLPPRVKTIAISEKRALTPSPLPPPSSKTILLGVGSNRSKSLTRCENQQLPRIVVKSAASSILISTDDPNTNAASAAHSALSSPIASPSDTKPMTKNALKRNNSYRLANEDLKLEMNKENLELSSSNISSISNTLPHPPKIHKNVLSTTHETNNNNINNHTLITSPVTSNNTPQRTIAKSFERLMDQFSLSTTSIDSSYLRNKSLENFDEAGENFMPPNGNILDSNTNPTQEISSKCTEDSEAVSDTDSDLDFIAPRAVTNKYQKSFIENVLLRPFKIIMPNDEGARRQRILQKFEVTEIW